MSALVTAGDLAVGDRFELAGLTHTVVQVRKAQGLVRIVAQCNDPALIETGWHIQGTATATWLANAPVQASRSQAEPLQATGSEGCWA